MINKLLDTGADINVDDGEALVSACYGGKIHIVKLVVEAGVSLPTQHGVTGLALQTAAKWGYLDICKYLISLGADVNSQGGEDGFVSLIVLQRQILSNF
jgi:ankyrin repeat protein